jgi:hypothetical protein
MHRPIGSTGASKLQNAPVAITETSSAVTRWAAVPLLLLDSCHTRQNVEHYCKIQLLPSHASRCS